MNKFMEKIWFENSEIVTTGVKLIWRNHNWLIVTDKCCFVTIIALIRANCYDSAFVDVKLPQQMLIEDDSAFFRFLW